ncbi:MAG: hypothetical protein WCK85_04165 [Chlorobium sp.]
MSDMIERQVRQFRGFLIFSGMFNILLAAPLMVPEFYTRYLSLLWKLNGILLLGGRVPVAPSGGVNALLINTAGIDLVLIGIFVLYASRDPLSRWFIPAINAAARVVFAGLILYYVLVYDIARIVLLIGCLDLFISVVFACYLISLRKLRSA